MLILAYRDTCPYCVKFKPIWNKFKKKYENVIDIREVDVTKQPDVSADLGVKGVPAIILVNGGKVVFKGERTLENLEKFVKENMNSKTT